VGLGVASGKWFLTENFTRIMFYRTGIGAVCNVILNLILIDKFNIYGAAGASLIAQMIAAYFFDMFGKRTFKSFILKTNAFISLPRYLYAKIFI
jgi:O-antigen/teichoic acid export membrane protein